MIGLRVIDFLPEFVTALKEELRRGEAKHGKAWLQLPRKGQEQRIRNRIMEYFNEWEQNGEPVPWLSIAGNAMIGWIRDTYPQYWKE